jgi:hypothetical protein
MMRFFLKTTCYAVWLFAILGMTSVSADPVDHSLWEKVLSETVDDKGFVDYIGLSENPTDLKAYLNIIYTQGPQTTPEKFPTANDELAYYLNAYNALVFQGVLDWGPKKSSIWKGLISGLKFFVLMDVHLDGQTTSLKKLEDDIIRARYRDPRIHAAINCASVSCPRLRQTAFIGDLVQDQLDEAMTEFVLDSKHVILREERVYVSAIFDWFTEDFVSSKKNTDQAIIVYINQFRGADHKVPIEARLKFLKYDKSINRQK